MPLLPGAYDESYLLACWHALGYRLRVHRLERERPNQRAGSALRPFESETSLWGPSSALRHAESLTCIVCRFPDIFAAQEQQWDALETAMAAAALAKGGRTGKGTVKSPRGERPGRPQGKVTTCGMRN